MRLAIARYCSQPVGDDEDPMVGCVLLRDVFFVNESEAISPPPDFATNIVIGKSYGLESESGSYLEAALGALLRTSTEVAAVPGAAFGDSRLVAARLGQRAFKADQT